MQSPLSCCWSPGLPFFSRLVQSNACRPKLEIHQKATGCLGGPPGYVGGMCGNLGRSGFMQSQGWALLVKKSKRGTYCDGSSNVPARMPSISCKITALLNNCDPQVVQNPRLTIWPLSPFTTKYFTSPLMLTDE